MDTLPRLLPATLGDTEREVTMRSKGPRGFEGEGFPVRRAFAGVAPSILDPFIMMDEMGAVEYAPGEPRGTAWHPHRGFETVTYLLDGAFLHQDSHGGGGRINPGSTQWMTAGSGILHIETPPEELVMSGGAFHGVQLWVNLPPSLKMTMPRYQGIESAQLTELTNHSGAGRVRLIAGTLGEHTGPGSTHTPITLAHVTLPAGEQVSLPWSASHNALVYALSGSGSIGTQGAQLGSGELVVLGRGDRITLTAGKSELDALVLGGEPIKAPVYQHGPFVMNSPEEIRQAMLDYQQGRFGHIPPDALMPFHAA